MRRNLGLLYVDALAAAETAGRLPEPGTLLLLILGGASLLGHRSHRR